MVNNTAPEGGTLVRIFESEDNIAPPVAGISTTHQPKISTRSARLTNEEVPSETRGGKSGVVESDHGPVYDQEFVIDKIVAHKSGNGPHYFRVRWYGYRQEDDTWEPMEHLPKSSIVHYFRRKKLPVPPPHVLDKATPG